MQKLIIALILIVISSSCLTTKSERLESKRQRKCDKAAWRWGCNQGGSDSIMKITETVTVFRDTTIYIHLPGEVVHDTVPVEMDKNGLINSKTSYLTTSFAESWAWVKNGKQYHRLSQNDTLIAKNIENAIMEKTSTTVTDKTKTIKVEVNRLTPWQLIQLWMGRIFMILLIVLLGLAIWYILK